MRTNRFIIIFLVCADKLGRGPGELAKIKITHDTVCCIVAKNGKKTPFSGAYAGGEGLGGLSPPKNFDLSDFLFYNQNFKQNFHYIRILKKCLQAPRKVSSPPQTKILRTPLFFASTSFLLLSFTVSKDIQEMNLDNRRAEQMNRGASTLSTLSDVGMEDGRQLSRRDTSIIDRGLSRQVRNRENFQFLQSTVATPPPRSTTTKTAAVGTAFATVTTFF